MTYNKRVLIQFEQMFVEGEIIIRNKFDKIIHKQKIKNKNFVMIELNEIINQLSIEILDNIENSKVIKSI